MTIALDTKKYPRCFISLIDGIMSFFCQNGLFCIHMDVYLIEV